MYFGHVMLTSLMQHKPVPFECKTLKAKFKYDITSPLLKMKRIILIFLLLIVIMTIVFIAASTLTNPTGFVTADIEENDSKETEVHSFRIYTKAVCENESDLIVCQDELFANCQGIEYKLPKNEVNGKGVFSKDWKDPRNSS